MKKFKNIKIEEVAFNKLKEHCNKNGIKLYSWVTKTVLNQLLQEENNAHLQNKKQN